MIATSVLTQQREDTTALVSLSTAIRKATGPVTYPRRVNLPACPARNNSHALARQQGLSMPTQIK